MTTKKAATEQVITIPALDIRTATIKIVGDSPLIMHKWAEKAKKEILDKQMKKAKSKGHDANDPLKILRPRIMRNGKDRWGYLDRMMLKLPLLTKQREGHSKKGVETMSEKEKTILEKMAQLPPELQDKMAAQIDGAVMVLDMLGKGEKGDEK